MISLGFFWKGLGFFYYLNFTYNRWLIEFPNTILASCMVLILAHLKDQKIKPIYFVYCLLITLTQFSILIYISFFEQLPLHIPSMQVSIAIKTIRIVYSISTIAICCVLIFKILSTLKKSNDYIAQLKNWYFILSFIFIISAFAFTSIDFASSTNSFPLLLNICTNILYVIAILYRPNFINNSNIKLKAKTSFSLKELDNMDDAIFINHFFYQKYYLKVDANMEDFAEIVGFKPEVIRKHISTNYQFSFIALTNKRIILIQLMWKNDSYFHILVFFIRHLSLQYFTSSHTFSHFLRQLNGLKHTIHILACRFCFFIIFITYYIFHILPTP